MRKPQEDKIRGPWTPRGTLSWPSFGGAKRPSNFPGTILKGSDMRIAKKVDFARMYFTKSRLLEVGGTLNICLKPPTTFVLGHQYAKVKLERQTKKR